MQRNLRLYLVYQVAHNGYFWLPVFFLYFSSILPAGEVLLLEAIYYLGVVVLEVPSGYLSDRIGRRVILVLSMAMWLGACLVFAFTSSFAAFAAGQLLLSAGMAFNSGSDTSLAAIAAEALGIPMSSVIVAKRDTDMAPYTGQSGGSRVVYSQGTAVQRAASIIAQLQSAPSISSRISPSSSCRPSRVPP